MAGFETEADRFDKGREAGGSVMGAGLRRIEHHVAARLAERDVRVLSVNIGDVNVAETSLQYLASSRVRILRIAGPVNCAVLAFVDRRGCLGRTAATPTEAALRARSAE